MSWLTELTFMEYITEVIDILIVSFVIYKLFTLIRGTRAIQLLKGILIVVAGWLLGITFGLNTLSWLMSQTMTYGVLGVMIIFQPELRRALEQLGRGTFFSRSSTADEEKIGVVLDETVKAIQYMAKRRIGALIVFERETGLNDYIETGTSIDGKLTSELMINIFRPNTPSHDGAVIVRKDKIMAAGCYLPLSENPFISKELGTRHRAALGLSELTDSLSIIVSEETGHVSVSMNGEVHRDLSADGLAEVLKVNLNQQTKPSPSFWSRGKNNG